MVRNAKAGMRKRGVDWQVGLRTLSMPSGKPLVHMVAEGVCEGDSGWVALRCVGDGGGGGAGVCGSGLIVIVILVGEAKARLFCFVVNQQGAFYEKFLMRL